MEGGLIFQGELYSFHTSRGHIPSLPTSLMTLLYHLGRYGDNLQEMAWAVGAIMDEVKQLNLDNNTIVFFISDNGPQIELCSEGGDAGVFKGTT